MNNIRSKDPFYRYKIPPIKIKVEKKKNQTVLLNLDRIGKVIDRNPLYILKHFGYRLGTNTYTKDLHFFIKGLHEIEVLADLLDSFVDEFVCCPICMNPETIYKMMFTQVWIQCKACGGLRRLSRRIPIVNFIRNDLLFKKKL